MLPQTPRLFKNIDTTIAGPGTFQLQVAGAGQRGYLSFLHLEFDAVGQVGSQLTLEYSDGSGIISTFSTQALTRDVAYGFLPLAPGKGLQLNNYGNVAIRVTGHLLYDYY